MGGIKHCPKGVPNALADGEDSIVHNREVSFHAPRSRFGRLKTVI